MDKKRVSAYVDPDVKRELDRRAEADPDAESLSDYLSQMIDRELSRDAEEEVVRKTRAVSRVERVLEQHLQEMEDLERELRHLNAKTGAYAIANFEFSKQDHGEAEIREALQTGARRLRSEEIVPEELGDLEGSDDTPTHEDQTDDSVVDIGGLSDE